LNLLLDTHVVLWWRAGGARILPAVRDEIATADAVFVSVASAWEIALKQAFGKVKLPESFARGVDRSGFARLTVTFEHAERAAILPRHHRDPFDRMLVAQALAEGLRLVTAHAILARYDADIVLAE
jgi:PIN domain nuclease of toxin-antitoxin system